MADHTTETDCIRGTGTIQRGYYRKTVNNVTYQQHRLAYMEKHGPVDSWLIIHHNCHNKWCVNAEHLVAMTRSEHQRVHANHAAREYYQSLVTCKRGHPLDGKGKRQRYCKTCHIMADRRYQARKAEALTNG